MISLRLSHAVPAVFACTAVVCAFADPAEAQSRRPNRAIFGGVGETDDLLAVSGSVAGGVDDNLAGTSGGFVEIIDPDTGEVTIEKVPTEAQQFVQFNGALSYEHRGDRFQFTGGINSVGRRYTGIEGGILDAHAVTFTEVVELARNTSLSATQAVSYTPIADLAIYPTFADGFGTRPPVDLDSGIRRGNYLGYLATVDLSHRVSRRGTFSLSYSGQRQLLTGDVVFMSQNANARYTYGLTRNISLRAGYGLSRATFLDGNNVNGNNFDFGADYNKAIGLTRRTHLTFGTGASAIEYDDTLSYFVSGNVRLTREIARTWSAWFGYDRGAQFLQTFNAPVYADSLTAGVSGLLTRRWQFNSYFSTAFANVGSPNADGYDNYYGGLSLTYGFSRNMGLSINYTMFRYDFGTGVDVPTGFPPEMIRHSVTAGFTMWFPLLERARRVDAAR